MNALAVVKEGMLSCVRLPAALEHRLAVIRDQRPYFHDWPVIEPDERQLIPAAVRAIDETLVGATPEEISLALGTISCALPKRQSDDEAEKMLAVYIAALSDIPADVLNKAAMEAVKTLKFFPKVAELRELAGKELAMRRWAKFVLETLARKHDEEWRAGTEKMVEPRQLASLASKLARRFPSKRSAA